ncbi:MAG: MFS transporter [Flavobacteriales bacterium]|nr:MFS transporter [Flavobacteriales bacterium]HQW41289.1 MFS transporter [Flavobacteriales bacterium]
MSNSLNGVNAKSKGTLALSESAPLRYITFAALYVAQGIPEGLTFFAIPAWLAMNGVDAGTIGGYLAIILLPWSFKLFAGPLMDRYSYLPMGKRRPWVVFGQLGLTVSFLSMVLIPDPLNNITMLSVMGFTVSFFGAFQDVATDGMAVDIIPVGQQAKANGLMWGAKTLGTSASLAAGTWLINNMGFPYAVTALSVTVFLIMLLPLLLRERPGEKRFPWEGGLPSKEALAMKVETWSEILFTLKNAFMLRTSLALALMGFLFCIGIGFMDALLPIYTIQELGWTNDAYSNILASVSTAGAFLAMAVAGWLVDRIGKVRILNSYLILMVAIPIIVALTRDHWMVSGYGEWLIAGYETLYTFIMVAYLATSMNLCWKRVAATQFTLYMAIGNMGRAVGSSLLGPARTHFDWPGTFLVYAVFMVLALVTVQAFQLMAHQRSLDRLEADHTANLPPDLGGPLVPR